MTVSLAGHGQPLATVTQGLETIVFTCCVTLGRLLDFSGLSQVSVWLLPSSLLGVSSEDPGPAELLLISCTPQGLSMTLNSVHTHITGVSLSPWQIIKPRRGRILLWAVHWNALAV